MTRARRLVATAAAVAVGTLGLAVPADAAEKKVSTAYSYTRYASDPVIVVQTHYRDYGDRGRTAYKVCAWDVPNRASNTIRVTVEYAPWVVIRMGEYKQGESRCKTIPKAKRVRVKQDDWRARGKAVKWRVGGVDLASFYWSARGRFS